MAEPLVLNLDAPQDGIVPRPDANLHEAELGRVVYRIRERALEAKAARSGRRCAEGGAGADDADDGDRRDRRRQADCEDDCLPRIDHSRRGILIDAERGVGKTTFLRAICATVNNYERFKHEPDAAGAPKARVSVRVLPLLDPTLIDGDRVFLATVIANLLDVIERARGRRDVCDRDGRAKEQRFQAALAALHAGLAASADEAWHKLTAEGSADSRFIDQLLRLARGGISMADRFECFVRAAADLLDVDMFVQPIDDVDVAQAEAWTTLEVVRRYLSGPTLLPVVAANLPKLEAAVLRSFVKEDEPLLKHLSGPAATMVRTTTLPRHVELLDRQTSQYLTKLFLVDDRAQLHSKRVVVLQRGAVRLAGVAGLVPISPPAPPSGRFSAPARSLLGDVERALFASAGGWRVSTAGALVPENTRGLFDALRAMRRIAVAGEADLDEVEAGLLALVDVHRDALAAAGLRPEALASVVRLGVEPAQAAMIARLWLKLSVIVAAVDLRPEPVIDLLDAALGLRVAGDAAAALSMMSRLFRAAGTLGPDDVQGVAEVGEQGLSWAGTSTAVDFRRSGCGDQLPIGLRLRSPDLKAEPGFALALYERLKACQRPEEVELLAYLRRIDKADTAPSTSDKIQKQWFLSVAELGEVDAEGAIDALLALNLFGTRLVDGDAWIVDPARGLEALTHALQWQWQVGAGDAGARSLLYRLVDLRQNREHGRVPQALFGRDAEAVGSSANGARRLELPRAAISSQICERLSSWLNAGKAPMPRVRARILARITGRWHRALGELTRAAASRISTVGGYLERAVLCLLYAAGIEEVEAAALQRWTLNGDTPPTAYEDAIRPLVKLNHPTLFYTSGLADLGLAIAGRYRVMPNGPLLYLVKAVRAIVGHESDVPPPPPLSSLMPITHLLWSCPLLRLCLSAEWSKALDPAVKVDALSYGTADQLTAHDWLCAIPFFGETPGERRPQKETANQLPDWLKPPATEPAPPAA